MRLLLFTQAIDRNDPVLSAYHRLVAGIASGFEKVIVVCLKKGEHDMPSNVEVLSLGKESGRSRIKYVGNFYRYAILRRKEYDAVFVHMNQEYVLLGGLLWKLFGKSVYMWRNHHAGSFLTDVAAFFCRKVFCTSKYSYTAKYKKTELMPVGIDTSVFRPDQGAARVPGSILFLARISPVKKLHVLIDALAMLKERGIGFTASFYGDPLPQDREYYESLKAKVTELNLSGKVRFHSGVSNERTVAVYGAHQVFVNLSSSGMYDKTIFEAMACETLSLASNRNLEGLIDAKFIFKEGDVIGLANKLETLLSLSREEQTVLGKGLRKVVEDNHSLDLLVRKLKERIKV